MCKSDDNWFVADLPCILAHSDLWDILETAQVLLFASSMYTFCHRRVLQLSLQVSLLQTGHSVVMCSLYHHHHHQFDFLKPDKQRDKAMKLHYFPLKSRKPTSCWIETMRSPEKVNTSRTWQNHPHTLYIIIIEKLSSVRDISKQRLLDWFIMPPLYLLTHITVSSSGFFVVCGRD